MEADPLWKFVTSNKFYMIRFSWHYTSYFAEQFEEMPFAMENIKFEM